LIDFGCAQAIAPSPETPPAPGSDLRFGSPAYMSPEQLLGGTIDPRTDVWGLGVLAYEALTGKRPFAGGSGVELTMRILTKGFVPVTRRVPSLPKRLDAWFVRALSKKPSRRFETAADAAKAFAAALAAPPLRRVPSPGKRPFLPTLRRAVPAVAVLALVAADAAMSVGDRGSVGAAGTALAEVAQEIR
jgi:serine/threonine protein kinase